MKTQSEPRKIPEVGRSPSSSTPTGPWFPTPHSCPHLAGEATDDSGVRHGEPKQTREEDRGIGHLRVERTKKQAAQSTDFKLMEVCHLRFHVLGRVGVGRKEQAFAGCVFGIRKNEHTQGIGFGSVLRATF